MNARVVQGEALLYRLIDGNVTSPEVISLFGAVLENCLPDLTVMLGDARFRRSLG